MKQTDETPEVVEVVESQDLVIKEENQMPIVREEMTLTKLMDMANTLSKSTIVPISYQNRPENCLIALDMANRMGVSPMVVMQNLHVIQGKPSWSGQAIASMVKNNPRFKDVHLTYVGERDKDNWGAYVSAVDVRSGKELTGATVTLAISKKEGWYQKTGSKWQTMPELMLAYRAYAWFGRVYCPEIMMGLQSTEEVVDSTKGTLPQAPNPFEKVEGK
jgi:hypothetical protein